MSDSQSDTAVDADETGDAEIVDMTEEEIPDPKPDVQEDSEPVDHLEDEAPMDIGEAMAAEATATDEEVEQEQDDDLEHDYDNLVEEGAFQVHEGICRVSDLALPDGLLDDGHALDQYQDDVRAFLDDHADDFETPVQQPRDHDDDESQQSVAEVEHSVDWTALWDEFGFDSRDAAGSVVVSKTQLIGAIESSDQAIAGDALAHIQQGVETGTLKQNMATSHEGTQTLRGFVITELYA